MSLKFATVVTLTLAAAAPAALAQSATAPTSPDAATTGLGGTYTFDADHSHIVFDYDHMGFSQSHGLIRGVTGTITIDAADPSKSTVEASVPLSSLMTVSSGLDKELTGDELFKGQAPDTAITFKSTSVSPDDDDEADVTGDLTLNGVTRPVTLEVDLRKAGEHPMTKKPALGFTAEGKIKRSDFNLGAFAPAVEDEVEFKIEVEAQKG